MNEGLVHLDLKEGKMIEKYKFLSAYKEFKLPLHPM